MSSTETLLQATINRISVRLKRKLIHAISKFSIFAKDAPERIKEEWDIFQEEVIIEAERLETQEDSVQYEDDQEVDSQKCATEKTSQKIGRLRDKVAKLNRRAEALRE